MTYPVSATFKKVAAYIAARVPRPKELPKSSTPNGNGLSFSGGCPLGLCSTALSQYPSSAVDFTSIPFTTGGIVNFWAAWDTFTDPQRAVNTVWGGEMTKEKIVQIVGLLRIAMAYGEISGKHWQEALWAQIYLCFPNDEQEIIRELRRYEND